MGGCFCGKGDKGGPSLLVRAAGGPRGSGLHPHPAGRSGRVTWPKATEEGGGALNPYAPAHPAPTPGPRLGSLGESPPTSCPYPASTPRL